MLNSRLSHAVPTRFFSCLCLCLSHKWEACLHRTPVPNNEISTVLYYKGTRLGHLSNICLDALAENFEVGFAKTLAEVSTYFFRHKRKEIVFQCYEILS